MKVTRKAVVAEMPVKEEKEEEALPAPAAYITATAEEVAAGVTSVTVGPRVDRSVNMKLHLNFSIYVEALRPFFDETEVCGFKVLTVPAPPPADPTAAGASANI